MRKPIRKSLHVETHIQAAIDWILQAHAAAKDGCISKGFDLLRARWAPSYPETTGYTIPTLLNVARIYDRPDLKSLAIKLSDNLIPHLTPEGGVAHWQSGTSSQPIIFDTGQVIFGWVAAYAETQDDRFLTAAKKAGGWLVDIQDPSGAWIEGQYLGVTKVIDSRVAWALLELERYQTGNGYRKAAIQNLEWVQQQQDPDGWFNHCAFTTQEDPFTHTIAYTAEGLVECGLILQNNTYISSAKRTADALLQLQRKDGSLASSYARNWSPSARSSCLTGNCQIARLWLHFYDLTEDRHYLEAAMKTMRSVARTQVLRPSPTFIYGGIAGSHPIYGRYERFKYPNWAAKFFIDALLRIEKQNTSVLYPG